MLPELRAHVGAGPAEYPSRTRTGTWRILKYRRGLSPIPPTSVTSSLRGANSGQTSTALAGNTYQPSNSIIQCSSEGFSCN